MSAGVAGRKVYWRVASWAFASAIGSCILMDGVQVVFFFLSFKVRYNFVYLSGLILYRYLGTMVVALFGPIIRYRYRKAWRLCFPTETIPAHKGGQLRIIAGSITPIHVFIGHKSECEGVHSMCLVVAAHLVKFTGWRALTTG